MPGNFHPAEVPYDPSGVDAEPSTQAPNDYFNVHANPDDFGGQIGQAFQHLGSGIKDAAEQFGQIQALHDNAAANSAQNSVVQGLNNLYAPPKLDAQGNPVAGSGGYYSLRGSDATNAWQPTVQKINEDVQTARAALTPRQQIMFDAQTRRLVDSELQSVGRHAAGQAEVWQDQQTTALVSTTSNAAALAAVNGKPDDFDHYLDQAASAAAHLSLLKGLGNDYAAKEAAQTIGATVANTAKQLIDLGRPNDAQTLFDKYGDRMDKGSALAVESALKAHTRDLQAAAYASWYRNGMQGPPPPVGDHGGAAQPAGGAPSSTSAPTGTSAPASTPVPKEYADKGVSQAEWDRMNVPDADQTAAPAAPAQAGAQPASNAPAGPTPSHAAPGGSDTADAASVLRHFEGFRSSPYWDVNHYRVGYGSDTITKADGTVETVTQGARVSRADAERDLARRASISANSASNSVGAQQWAQLPGPAQAALTSVTYNYGHLPESVAAAAKTGDVNKIADAVEALKGDNGGVNADRREKEAAIIRGGGFPGGPAPSVAAGGQSTPPPPIGQPAPSARMVSGDQSAQPSDIGASHQQKADLYQNQASAIDDAQRRFAHDPEMVMAITGKIREGMAVDALNQKAQEQQDLVAQDAGYKKYVSHMIKGDIPADQLMQQIAADKSLSGTTTERLINAANSMGQGKALGTDFYSFFKRIQSNGPDKITSPDQIYGSVDGKKLTIEGAEKIRDFMASKKTPEGEAIADLRKSALDHIERGLVTEAEYGNYKKLDPKGKALFNEQAIPAFDVAYQKGLDSGKTAFDLLTPVSKDYIPDKIVQTFKRSPAQEMKDTIGVIGGNPVPSSMVDTMISTATQEPTPDAATNPVGTINAALNNALSGLPANANNGQPQATQAPASQPAAPATKPATPEPTTYLDLYKAIRSGSINTNDGIRIFNDIKAKDKAKTDLVPKGP